jgi:enoyl-CoA hydratase
MPSYQNLTVAVEDRVAILTVNRPDKLNALDSHTIGELDAAIDELRGRHDVGGLVVTGAQRAFVAGADIRELAGQTSSVARERARRGQRVFGKFESSPKPVVAAVNGFALGGGCELALACHVRIASEAARFGQPEVKLGLVPGYGGTQRLPRLIGRGMALQLLLTGEIIDAREALRIGLVNRVVTAAELLTAATQLVRQMLANGPLALAACITAVNDGAHLSLADALALEAERFASLAETGDVAEGTAAFLEKRSPSFEGR